jgi:Cu(I)/Ag(I) efflux system membrane protein CusA/SilA
VIPAVYALVKGRGLPPAVHLAREAAEGDETLPQAAE